MNTRDILQPLVDLIETGLGTLDTILYGVERDIVHALDRSYDEGYEDGKEDGYDDGYDAGYGDGKESGEEGAYNEGYEAGLAAEREPLDPSEGR